MTILKLENIWKIYDEAVLKDVNLEVKRRELLAIMGPIGSGKTTLLKILAGIEEPTRGTIYYDGKKTERKYLRSRATMVFQRAIVFDTTVYKNVSYGLRVRDYPRNEIGGRVRNILKWIGMDGYEEKRAKKLSGGEQQKVSLARALVIEPEVLLLDEPTANLDPSTAKKIEELIIKIKNERTVVLATHNLFQARRLSDRTAFIYDGKIIEEGKTEELFQNPKDGRTRDFLQGKTVFG